MLKVFKFMKLDYLLIKKQLIKALLLMFAACVLIFFTSEDINFITFYPLFFAVITISYPFVFSEKNNMENFYSTLAINRGTVVRGRYMFSFVITLIFAIVSVILTIICASIKGISISANTIIINMGAIILITIFFAAIQMPVYFKLGFTKARIWTYIPFFLLFPLTMIVKYIPKNVIENTKKLIIQIQANSLISFILLILIALLIFEISMIISQSFYKNKEA